MNDEFAPAPAEEISAPEISTEGSPTPPEPVSEAPSRRDALERALAKVEGEEPEGPARGPDGKFAVKQPEAAKPVELKEPAKPDAAPASPLAEPPARFSPDAKAAWAQAPVPVQAEIKRAITELETGLRQKDEILAPLKPFFDMAQQHNVKVHDALGNYVRMEQMLAKDPRAGLTAIAENFGWTLDQMLAFVSDKPQAQGQPDQRDQTIVALRRELDAIKAQVGGVTQTLEQQRVGEVMKTVESFAAQNPRFGELENDILRLLQTGYADSLEAAYSIAERLNPAPQTAAPAAPAPAPQTRPVRSVTGAPNAGSTPGSRPPSSNRREALGNALAQVGL